MLSPYGITRPQWFNPQATKHDDMWTMSITHVMYFVSLTLTCFCRSLQADSSWASFWETCWGCGPAAPPTSATSTLAQGFAAALLADEPWLTWLRARLAPTASGRLELQRNSQDTSTVAPMWDNQIWFAVILDVQFANTFWWFMSSALPV